MKTSHKLIGAALIAAAGVAVVVPSATKAAPGDYTGKGKIVFTKNNTGTTNTPPGTTGPVIPGPVNSADEDLKIIFVSHLDFKQNELLTHGNLKTYDADVYKTNEGADGSGAAISMPNYVKFQDHRTDGLENHYTIKAEISKQFTHTSGHVMANAKLNYSNAKLVSATNGATMPTGAIANFALTYGAESTVLTNKEAGKGFGTHDIQFGDLGTNADKSVQLEIPGAVILRDGEYQAEVTWKIEDAR
ncbi:WxL domain-containing protein [Enterococcus sp. LJL128]|uniref:WxL domain-containing protein n=1 Tax=Enterococcus sp. LJL51 TaxID=3416656 RepID=UPI003CF5990F